MKKKFDKFKKSSVIAATFLLINLNLYSQTNSADTTIKQKPISMTGFIDFYYSHNFANPADRANKYRNFDVSSKEFNLSLAELVVQRPAEPVGFRLDLDFGPTTDLVHTGDSMKINETYKYIQQAYLSVVVPIGKGLTINGGKMVTHMGAEVIESYLNINYSRSLLFAYAIPYYHVGICALYPFSEKFSVTGYIMNGWNRSTENNTKKTFGGSVSWLPKDNLNIIGNWIGGAEETNTDNRRNVLEAIMNYTAGNNLSFVFDGVYGNERLLTNDIQIWKGTAITGKYSFSDITALALRAEVFSDPQGYMTGTAQDLKEITLTYEFKYLSNLILRLEYRRDWSTVNTFNNSDGINKIDNQNTILLGSVITF